LRVFLDFFDEPLQRSYSSFFPASGTVSAAHWESRQNYLSMMDRGKVGIATEILLWISRKFAKVEWLLTGED
jgi:hypothetical protein